MEELVKRILEIEWRFFDQVQNRGGRAACQEDPATFSVMRSSQLLAWNQAMRESYLRDLQAAQEQGRNPLAEKYGYMMERTSPLEYREIKSRLPSISAEKQALVNAICAVHVAWLEELSLRYPRLTGRGRAIHQSEDGPGTTSFETYLKGELSTYSQETLRLYRDYVEEIRRGGGNLHETILKNTVEQYGFHSLEEAEKKIGDAGA